MRGLVLRAGLIPAILLGAWIVTDVVGPVLEGGRVEHREAGFATTFPRDWEHTEAAVVSAAHREDDRWEATDGDPAQMHIGFERGRCHRGVRGSHVLGFGDVGYGPHRTRG